MAEVVGLVTGIASLVTMAMRITELSYSYVADIRSAHSTQKQYLREISALTEVLLRSEEASQNLEKETLGFSRPTDLFKSIVSECAQRLDKLFSELRKPSPSMIWPIQETVLKKHVEDLRRFRSIFADFLSAQSLAVVTATHQNITRLANHQDQADLLQWLGNPKDTSRSVPNPLPGTGACLVDSALYKQWTARSNLPLLWCYGPPGVGKSMLAAVAIQHLRARADSIPVLHYFFDFGNRKEHTKEAVWKDLLRQVIAKGSPSTVQKLVNFRKKLGIRRPVSSKDFSDALKIACAGQQFFLVLDGSDEMENPRELKTILVPFNNASVLVTSRDTPEIHSTLNKATAMEVQADASDMRVYVTSRFEECELDDLIERHPELEKEILEKSQGIFLLVRLLVDQLVDLSTVKEMRKALQVFPTHLDQAFESSLQRINSQSKSRSVLAHRVMGWIVSVERKLQISELAHGLATEEGVDVIDEENLVSSKTILKVCGGLVVLQGSAVSMVHTTVHTWLRSRYDGLYHEDLAESCLRYLTMRSFSSGVVQTLDEMDTRLRVFPFFSYAAQHWRSHLAKTEDANAFQSIDRLLDDSALRSAAFQGAHYKSSVKCPVIRGAAFETMPQGQSALHLASYWNLPVKVERLILDGEEKDATDTQMWTPLHWACFAYSQEAVEALVSLRVDTNVKDSVGWTPLFWAALNGDTRMVRFLLQHGAIHIERDIHGWTPLRWAVASLQIDVVKTLLEYHSNMPSNSSITLSTIKHLSFEETRVYIASYYQNIKRDLIDELESTLTGSDEYADEYHDLHAIFQEKTFDVKALLRSGRFDPPVSDAWRTWQKIHRLFWAKLYRYINTEFDTDRETAKSWKSRMLQSAIRNGKLPAVRLLLEAGAEVNPKAGQQEARQTPAATFKKDVHFAEMLTTYESHMEARTHAKNTPLKQEIATRFEDGTRRTPLMIACGLKSNDGDIELPARMVSLLLEYGADPNIKDGGGRIALHYGVLRRNPSTLKLLFDAGSNPDGLDQAGRTQLYNFVLHETSPDTQLPSDLNKRYTPGARIECLNILAQRLGSDFLNQSIDHGSDGRVYTPLSLAAVERDWEIFRALHRLGANFETNAPLEDLLDLALSDLQFPEAMILIENGARVPPDEGGPESSAKRHEWIRRLCLFSEDHEITDTEINRFRETMEMLISHGFNIDATGSDGNALLHHAVQRGSPKLVKCLLVLGANPYRENEAGVDSLLLACLSQKLINLKHLAGYKGKHTFPGHWSQHLDMPEALGEGDVFTAISKALKSAGEINMRCGEGSLLCEAASLDNWVLVEALLACGADPNFGTQPQILRSAAESGHISVVKLLIDSGAGVDTLALHDAASEGHVPVVKLLIDSGVGVDTFALYYAASGGHASVVKLLIDSGASIDISDESGRTSLCQATYEGHHEVVDVLLSSGADPDVGDCQGWRPLHFAAAYGHTETARLLLQAGASAGAVTSEFTWELGHVNGLPDGLCPDEPWTGTPLHLAAMAGSAEITRLLLEENVDVNARTDCFDTAAEGHEPPPSPDCGPTALHIALVTGSCRSGRKGCDLDKGRLEIASMLIERGASVEGAADHLRIEDLAKFENFPHLWDKLRIGITVAE